MPRITRRVLLVLCLLLLAGCGDSGGEGSQPNNEQSPTTWSPEVCDNGEDDNEDGRTDCQDRACYTHESCAFVPPNPAEIAPELPSGEATRFFDRVKFLLEGENAVIRGADMSAFEAQRVGASCGKVTDVAGNPVSGIAVSLRDNPEFGRTYTREDGAYDLVFNAGDEVVVELQKPGFVPVQRKIQSEWEVYDVLDDVVFVPLDANETRVDFEAPQFVEGMRAEDEDGARQTNLFVPAGVEAEMVFPNGATRPLDSMIVSATEVTVGERGPEAMMGDLPGASAYTYAVEFTVQEAVDAQAEKVQFNRPVYGYLDNYLEVPAGSLVPNGYYDRARQEWVPQADGVVLELAGISGGLAELAAATDGSVASRDLLNALDISDAELRAIAQNYEIGESFWRFPLEHLSPFDENFAWIQSELLTPPGGADGDHPTCNSPLETGSVIDCEDQHVREFIPMNGTPFTLVYSSSRVPGRLPTIRVPLATPDQLANRALFKIEASVEVAGQKIEGEWNRQDAPEVWEVQWNRKDAFGRPYQGSARAKIEIQFYLETEYAAGPISTSFKTGLRTRTFTLDAEEASNFAQPPRGASEGFSFSRNEQITFRKEERYVSNWNVAEEDFGGWTLDILHRYDPVARALHFGNGDSLYSNGSNNQLELVVGSTPSFETGQPANYNFEPLEEGEDLSNYAVDYHQITPAADGGFYFLSKFTPGRILRASADGVVSFVAGDPSSSQSAEDGADPKAVTFSSIDELEISPDGVLYISADEKLWRIDGDKLVWVAFDPEAENSLEDAPDGALAKELRALQSFNVGQDGLVYVKTGEVLYRLMPNGRVYHFAGNWLRCGESYCPPEGCQDDVNFCEGGLATETPFDSVKDFDVAADGTAYIVSDNLDGPAREFQVLRKISPSGIVETIGPVTLNLQSENLLALGPNGEIYIGNGSERPHVAANRVLDDGRLVVAAGRVLVDDQRQIPNFYPKDGSPANSLLGNADVFVWGDGTLVFNYVGGLFKVAPLLPGYTGNDYQIPSQDGSRIFRFSPGGRHLETRDAMTGSLIWSFEYDAEKRLSAVVDRDDNRYEITRGSDGQPATISNPDGFTWNFTSDANGYFTRVEDPGGNAWQPTYDDNGLLIAYADPEGHSWTFEYDEAGRLTREVMPNGGEQTLEREYLTGRYRVVTFTSASGRQTQYGLDYTADNLLQTRDTSGRETRFVRGEEGVNRILPDGTVIGSSIDGHPIYGYRVPKSELRIIQLPSGKQFEATWDRSAQLSDSSSLAGMASYTEQMDFDNMRTIMEWDGASRTLTQTSEQRVSRVVYDELGRVVEEQAPGSLPVIYTYDSRGRPTTVTQGDRVHTITYDSDGFVASITTPDMQSSNMSRDAAGYLENVSMPDGESFGLVNDSLGRTTVFRPPGAGDFDVTYDSRGMPLTFTTPGAASFTYQYDLDHQPESMTDGDGRVLTYDLDDAQRLSAIVDGPETFSYGYNDETGQLVTAASSQGATISMAYDGILPRSIAWSGPFDASIEYQFDDAMRLEQESVDGQVVAYEYDGSGLVTAAGDMTIAYPGQDIRPRRRAIGNATEDLTYDDYGALETIDTVVDGIDYYDVSFVYDSMGRITSKTEQRAGVEKIATYAYDDFGRLVSETVDGVESVYTWDQNSNLVGATNRRPDALQNATDNLSNLTIGSGDEVNDWTYNGAGQATRIGGNTLEYGMLSQLRAFNRANGVSIRYEHDGMGRRVAKYVDGTFERGWIYRDALNPIAEIDSAGNVSKRFVYGTRANVPDYMLFGGNTYFFVTDHQGSVQYVVNAETGAPAQELEYDAFGRVLTDTNPGFQPFGFAGGIYDHDTELVRFGTRDYFADYGRWTSIDTIGFSGGRNLHLYANGDPVNFIDLDGQNPLLLIGFAALVGGAFGGFGYMIFTPGECRSWQGAAGWMLGGAVAGAFAAIAPVVVYGAFLAGTLTLGGALVLGVAGGAILGGFGGSTGYQLTMNIDPIREATVEGKRKATIWGAGISIASVVGVMGGSGFPGFALGGALSTISKTPKVDGANASDSLAAKCSCD